jgi:hypothetical protein
VSLFRVQAATSRTESSNGNWVQKLRECMKSDARSERHTSKPGRPGDIMHAIASSRPNRWRDLQTRADGSNDFEGIMRGLGSEDLVHNDTKLVLSLHQTKPKKPLRNIFLQTPTCAVPRCNTNDQFQNIQSCSPLFLIVVSGYSGLSTG